MSVSYINYTINYILEIIIYASCIWSFILHYKVYFMYVNDPFIHINKVMIHLSKHSLSFIYLIIFIWFFIVFSSSKDSLHRSNNFTIHKVVKPKINNWTRKTIEGIHGNILNEERMNYQIWWLEWRPTW